MDAIERAKIFSAQKLSELRQGLVSIVPAKEIVVTCGSYARQEASAESDIDFFVIAENTKSSKESTFEQSEPRWLEDVKSTINKVVPLAPSPEGAFGRIETPEIMLKNIGGDGDTNAKITRRMLFLLEGNWLVNETGLKAVRRQILERYIRSGMTDHQLALFLLNDIVRYYRTMAVDYEFKTVEGEVPKPWGIRNIKLVFSRKLLYASGLFSIALTADQTRDQKINLLERLFDMPVIDRMTEICGKVEMSPVLASYNRFLDQLENKETRTRLKTLQPEQRDDPLFRELKNEGHYFTRELMRLFERTFDSTRPIRRAIVF